MRYKNKLREGLPCPHAGVLALKHRTTLQFALVLLGLYEKPVF